MALLATFILICILTFLLAIEYTHNRSKMPGYNIKVFYGTGVSIKMTLNTEQYEQFEAWFANKDGIFEIGDSRNKVTLVRGNVAAVKMSRR